MNVTITLQNFWRSGDYVVTWPGQPEVRLTADEAGPRPFDTTQDAAGLTNGYWLKRGDGFLNAEGRRYSEWTWTQL